MSTAHLAAVTDFLRARALHLHLGAMIDALLDLVEAYPADRLTAEAITHLVLGTSIASVDPATWLESTPLLRAIQRELATRP